MTTLPKTKTTITAKQAAMTKLRVLQKPSKIF
jgi:hypothetical protein